MVCRTDPGTAAFKQPCATLFSPCCITVQQGTGPSQSGHRIVVKKMGAGATLREKELATESVAVEGSDLEVKAKQAISNL